MSVDDIQEKTKDQLATDSGSVSIYNIRKISNYSENIAKLPYSLKILLENIIRNQDGKRITNEHVLALCEWTPNSNNKKEIPFIPTRVLLQDFTGVPAMVDLAALRSEMARIGGDPSKINPNIPADLIIDHSIQVDYYKTDDALEKNEVLEMKRNEERYTFLKWAQNVFDNFRVVPTSRGICHQINLEYLTKVIHLEKQNGVLFAYPDTLIGTDSHTTMINSLGVLGWGVGGIEAEAVLLNQPYYMPLPKVVGVKLKGNLPKGITATDSVLTITEILRNHGVVGKFVEFFGPGLRQLPLEDRATISNMAPEYGATIGYFPIDEETLIYLEKSGRNEELIKMVKMYSKKVGLFYDEGKSEPNYSEVLEIDLGNIDPSLAGPKRPQDRIRLKTIKENFIEQMKNVFNKPDEIKNISNGNNFKHGAIAIAAITSCTNTSNPHVMIGAGLLAKKAIDKGLHVKDHVKTSFAPGSRVVTEYMKDAGLLKYLKNLGFNLVGYGCTTCIGNSGPLEEALITKIMDEDLIVASILSGNRNFEGRISPHIKANFLASPPLVVAFALAGTIFINLEEEPLGKDKQGVPVYLRDIWPTPKEINDIISNHLKPDMFQKEYSEIFEGWKLWNELKPPEGNIYKWDELSTYIQEPPFFIDFPVDCPPVKDIKEARVLAVLGDSITTDHISPAGKIPENSPAGQYLISKGVKPMEFNSYGSRRGNHEVMMRGTFANIRITNQLVNVEGGYTLNHLTEEITTIYEAAMRYKEKNVPLILLAGKDYGMGSSRDWAAKGTQLLGIKAVIAESYERIHRSNLVGMGVLPLQFKNGENSKTLKLDGTEIYNIIGLEDLYLGKELSVNAIKNDGKGKFFKVIARLDTPIDIEYYQNKGILHKVLRDLIKKG